MSQPFLIKLKCSPAKSRAFHNEQPRVGEHKDHKTERNIMPYFNWSSRYAEEVNCYLGGGEGLLYNVCIRLGTFHAQFSSTASSTFSFFLSLTLTRPGLTLCVCLRSTLRMSNLTHTAQKATGKYFYFIRTPVGKTQNKIETETVYLVILPRIHEINERRSNRTHNRLMTRRMTQSAVELNIIYGVRGNFGKEITIKNNDFLRMFKLFFNN